MKFRFLVNELKVWYRFPKARPWNWAPRLHWYNFLKAYKNIKRYRYVTGPNYAK